MSSLYEQRLHKIEAASPTGGDQPQQQALIVKSTVPVPSGDGHAYAYLSIASFSVWPFPVVLGGLGGFVQDKGSVPGWVIPSIVAVQTNKRRIALPDGSLFWGGDTELLPPGEFAESLELQLSVYYAKATIWCIVQRWH